MPKLPNKRKLWQSMINLDLTPDEFIRLQALGRIREQSLRKLVSLVIREELKAFKDIIEPFVLANVLLPSLEANTSKKRNRGRPRTINARTYIKETREQTLPASMLDLIDDK